MTAHYNKCFHACALVFGWNSRTQCFEHFSGELGLVRIEQVKKGWFGTAQGIGGPIIGQTVPTRQEAAYDVLVTMREHARGLVLRIDELLVNQ